MDTGLNILIIGASKGIGRDVVKQLCRQGHNILCVSRDASALELLKKECYAISPSSPVNILPFDILDLPADPSPLYDAINSVFTGIDILLYNAGLLIKKEFSEFQPAEIMDIFRINFFSAAAVIQGLLGFMGGERMTHIVNIGSMGGFQGSAKFPGLSFYSASKAALASLSECLAEEFKDRNIRINCLALGSAQTEMLEKAFPGYRSPISAAEMAEFISHFMVHGHRHFNGKVIPVSITTP
jgi:short-subunit dehydrogenase